jgi:hypothetical protein
MTPEAVTRRAVAACQAQQVQEVGYQPASYTERKLNELEARLAALEAAFAKQLAKEHAAIEELDAAAARLDTLEEKCLPHTEQQHTKVALRNLYR